jgi:hypothetical protein
MITTCGCCAPLVPPTPADIQNRPGLPAVEFRIGTFASFREAMLQRISGLSDLTALRTRQSDDYAIAILDMWATVSDILTFYQERIANEGFLRTAQQRDSLLRLARLVDYHLRPGVAATTLLTFTLEPAARLTIPARLRVQSVPAAGEKPQKYETLRPLAADGRLNRLRVLPAPLPAPALAAGGETAWLAPGLDGLIIAAMLTPGSRVVLHKTGSSAVEELTVAAVETRDDLFRVTWVRPVQGTAWTSGDVHARRFTRVFRLFGHDAPGAYLSIESGPVSAYRSLTDYSYAAGAAQLHLDTRYENVRPGTELLLVDGSSSAHVEVVSVTAVAQESVTFGPFTAQVTRVTLASPLVAAVDRRYTTVYDLAAPPIRFWDFAFPERIVLPALYVPGRRVDWDAIEVGRTLTVKGYEPGATLSPREIERGRPVLLLDERREPASAVVQRARLVGSDLRLTATPDDPATAAELGFASAQTQPVTALASAPLGTTLTLASAAPEILVTIGPLTRRVPIPGPVTDSASAATSLQQALRDTDPSPGFAHAVVLVRGQRLLVIPGAPELSLTIAPTPADATTAVELGLDRDRRRFVDGVLSAPLPATITLTNPLRQLSAAIGIVGPSLITLSAAVTTPATAATGVLTGLQAVFGTGAAHVDVIGGDRLLALAAPPADEAQDFLVLDVGLTVPVDLATESAALLANVVSASHGETVRNEIVGDADAAVAFQRFTLRKKPLTHLPGTGPRGLDSTLTLLVGGVRWTEVPTLYGRGPAEQVYTTRTADDGTVTVQFGDGDTGARPPSGRANVVADYRHGSGLAGRVRAGTLTNLLDRPRGLKAVTNTRAEGGADQETLADARRNAPATVVTFGRAVALRDFAALAMASGEVAKASATWVWQGATRGVHVTVAGQANGAFSSEGLARIYTRLSAQRDPNHSLAVDNFVRVPVVVEATLRVAAARVAPAVAEAARQALLDALSFEALAFGQPVNLSDVYRVLQDVAGVESVDIDVLRFKDRSPTFLADRGATAGPVQRRLRIYPARPSLSVPGHVLPAEQAWIEIPSQDVTLRTSGGLPS